MARPPPPPPPRNGYGGAFVELLAALGYDRGDLSAEMFDALFALPSMRVQAFLEWFLSFITPRQSVPLALGSANDYAIYAALVDGHMGSQRLLIGEDLVAQERLCHADAQSDESLDALLARNTSLEEEIAQLEAQLQRMNTKNDKIAKMVQRVALQADAHASSSSQQFGVEKEHFSELLVELHAPITTSRVAASSERTTQHISTQIDSIIEHLATTTSIDDAPPPPPPPSQPLASGRQHTGNPSAQWRECMYQQPLAALQDMELRNLDELKSKVASIVLGNPDSHSHGGAGALTLATTGPTTQNGHSAIKADAGSVGHEQQAQPPSWLHNSDPAALQLYEQDALIYNKCSLELARLEKAYAIGEQDALLARMQLAKNESLWQQLSETKHLLFQQHQLMNPSALSMKRMKLLESIEATKQELKRFVHSVLPKVFVEMAFLKSTTILLGSYEQKLWRQELRFLKLRALLDAFDHQHGRLKLVHRLLDAEWEDLVAADTILGSFFKDVQTENSQIQARLTHGITANGGGAHNASNSSGGAGSSILRSSVIPDVDEVAHVLYDYIQHRVQSNRQQRTIPNGGNTENIRRHSFRVRTFDELVRLCDQKRAEEASVSDNLDHVEQEWLQVYKRQREGLLALRKELFGDSASSTPMLLPPNLIGFLQEVVAAKEHTEQELHAALESLRMKKRGIAMDSSRRQQQTENFVRLRQELIQMGRLSSP